MGLEVLYLLIPVTLVLALAGLALFLWAIHSGQFDDLETPAIRILFDDEPDPHAEPACNPARHDRPGGGEGRGGSQSPPGRGVE